LPDPPPAERRSEAVAAAHRVFQRSADAAQIQWNETIVGALDKIPPAKPRGARMSADAGIAGGVAGDAARQRVALKVSLRERRQKEKPGIGRGGMGELRPPRAGMIEDPVNRRHVGAGRDVEKIFRADP
jgi:hypothetical protein